VFLNPRVQWENNMSAKGAPREANITDDNDEAATWYERTKYMSPNFIELIEKFLVILDSP